MVKTVLVVCHANTARSVMAHALLERMLAERGLHGRIEVRSGGVAPYARDGMLPSLDARLALRAVGIHLAEDGFVSTDLRRHVHLIRRASLILTMTDAQRRMVAALDGAAAAPILTLREAAGEHGDIADPAGQEEAVFGACRDEIARCLRRSLDRLLALLGADESGPPLSQ
jgi:protein-tyrosine-phosphatase